MRSKVKGLPLMPTDGICAGLKPKTKGMRERSQSPYNARARCCLRLHPAPSAMHPTSKASASRHPRVYKQQRSAALGVTRAKLHPKNLIAPRLRTGCSPQRCFSHLPLALAAPAVRNPICTTTTNHANGVPRIPLPLHAPGPAQVEAHPRLPAHGDRAPRDAPRGGRRAALVARTQGAARGGEAPGAAGVEFCRRAAGWGVARGLGLGCVMGRRWWRIEID
ncbi:hypothetical protein BJ912DRAFT_280774 [Pholiota molesta]|nr:hypothetical protein BJ912DRAFT_280774 [Pholiota molesta]